MTDIDIIRIFGIFVWAIPGIVGGIISALTIRMAESRVTTTKLMLIAFGWIAGMTIGGVVDAVIVSLAFSSDSLDSFGHVAFWIIGWSLTGMITALFGSWITYKVLEPIMVSEENAG